MTKEQLQAFLTAYTEGNVLIAENGTIEEVELTKQHFALTVTHKVLSSDTVHYVTFKQHENYIKGDEYNELSDVFNYDNVYSVTLVDGEVIEVEEKTNVKVETDMAKLNEENTKFLEKIYFNTYDTVFITEVSEGIARKLQNKNRYVYYDVNNFEEGGDLLKPNLSCHVINTLLLNSMYLYGHHNDTEDFEKFKKEVSENLDIMEELQYFFNNYNNFVRNFYKATE